MSIKTQLKQDMKQAMKAKDRELLNNIRSIISEIKNVEIDQGELDDQGVIKVIAKLLKQQKDALQDFTKAGREDLIEETQQRIKKYKQYLPDQLSEDELKQAIEKVQKENPNLDSGPLIGKVLQYLKQNVDNQESIDGQLVARLVKKMN